MRHASGPEKLRQCVRLRQGEELMLMLLQSCKTDGSIISLAHASISWQLYRPDQSRLFALQ